MPVVVVLLFGVALKQRLKMDRVNKDAKHESKYAEMGGRDHRSPGC